MTLDWAAWRDTPVLLINSDIELRLSPGELARIRALCDGGLCTFIRYNHDADPARAVREPNGIDAFLFRAESFASLGDSWLSMGLPFWDYWLPYAFLRAGRELHSVEFPAAFQRNHRQRWSYEKWLRCAREFARIGGLGTGDLDAEGCGAMATSVREAIRRASLPVPERVPAVQGSVHQVERSSAPG